MTPTFSVGDRVTITDHRIGRLRLTIALVEPNGLYYVLTTEDGSGRWRRHADELTPGWGN